VRSHLSFFVLTLLAALLALAFLRLGLWQWHKGRAREAERVAFARGAEQVLMLGTGPVAALPPYQRVAVRGTLDGAHQFLLDNRSYRGTPGYEVLTPLTRAGAATLLVDRGWVPFSGSRARLPAIGLASPAAVTLSGRLGNLPVAGLALGHAPPAGGPWPKVTSFPSTAELAAALGTPLEGRILLLDAASPDGYLRDWQPQGLAPLRHFAYAINWWVFALMALVFWGIGARRWRRAGGAR
jgi:cytochrome oxidase assembly protein ShyY1